MNARGGRQVNVGLFGAARVDHRQVQRHCCGSRQQLAGHGGRGGGRGGGARQAIARVQRHNVQVDAADKG